MKQQSDKYSIAWFKLAECVARGERERAMGVYRLLSHSFDEPAFTHQLMGDLLLAFDDINAATEQYELAAQRYKEQGRVREAAAAYEHIVTLHPMVDRHRREIVALYQELQRPIKIIEHVRELFRILMNNQDYEASQDLLVSLEYLAVDRELAFLRCDLVRALLAKKIVDVDVVLDQSSKIVDAFLASHDDASVTLFLAQLQALHQQSYNLVCEYVARKK